MQMAQHQQITPAGLISTSSIRRSLSKPSPANTPTWTILACIFSTHAGTTLIPRWCASSSISESNRLDGNGSSHVKCDIGRLGIIEFRKIVLVPEFPYFLKGIGF
jgi:hypothetical protein